MTEQIMLGITAVTAAVSAGALAAAQARIRRFTRRFRKGYGISIIIPFRCADPDDQRVRNLAWLKLYWKFQLPGAEVISGDDVDWDRPFSKSVAVNNGVAKSSGDILLIIDADGYISVKNVLHCASEIRAARAQGQRLWFVPYRQFYRLTEAASKWLLRSDPNKPHQYPEPLPHLFTLAGANDPFIGHWYGAMIQIMPREAFEITGGWDERFRGWGGEDAAALRATDTMYAPHKTLPGQVLHVWHPQLGPLGKAEQVHWKERMWEGQQDPGVNEALSMKYYGAYRNPARMRKLIDEGVAKSSYAGRFHRHERDEDRERREREEQREREARREREREHHHRHRTSM